MADVEHLTLLQQGTAIWNVWRIDNPGSLPDLSEADLSGADLRQTGLSGANVSEAFLSEAHLGRHDISVVRYPGRHAPGARHEIALLDAGGEEPAGITACHPAML